MVFTVFKELSDVHLPKMVKVKQQLVYAPLKHTIEDAIRESVQVSSVWAGLTKFPKGTKVAIGVGSRGIDQLAEVVKTVVNIFKELGMKPCIIPAMGSHGGATAEGQKRILESYGITEETMGVPIVSSMQVVKVGHTPEGVPVYFDKEAYDCDIVVAINRVKPHTEFSGEIESGVLKMLAIGFGKQRGAATLHAFGSEALSNLIVQAANVIIKQVPLIVGVGLLEDGYGQLSDIRVMISQEIEEEEKKLLKRAKDLMPRIPFSEIDVLLVDEMGKNISGAGLDTNVIGRRKPANTKIHYIVVRDLTPESHGNAAGMGLVDVITKRLFQKIDFAATYANCLTARAVEAAKLPMVANSDETAIKTAVYLTGKDPENVKIVRIKNTTKLAIIEISEKLLTEIADKKELQVISDAFYYRFDTNGELLNDSESDS